ncbi:3-methyl-2-oxobutanoate hydroxymethyltransferase, partial [Mesorhizobium sp. M7A.F.Ca.CA.001.14.1.1]
DVNSLAYPEDRHVVHMDPAELSLFMKRVDGA